MPEIFSAETKRSAGVSEKELIKIAVKVNGIG